MVCVAGVGLLAEMNACMINGFVVLTVGDE